MMDEKDRNGKGITKMLLIFAVLCIAGCHTGPVGPDREDPAPAPVQTTIVPGMYNFIPLPQWTGRIFLNADGSFVEYTYYRTSTFTTSGKWHQAGMRLYFTDHSIHDGGKWIDLVDTSFPLRNITTTTFEADIGEGWVIYTKQ